MLELGRRKGLRAGTQPPFPLVRLTVGMRINVTLKRIVECTGAGRREGGHSCGGPGRAKKDARHKIAAKHRSTQTGPAMKGVSIDLKKLEVGPQLLKEVGSSAVNTCTNYLTFNI